MRAGYSTRAVAVLLAFLVAYGPLKARGESVLFPDLYSELARNTGPKVVVLAVSLDKEADKRLGLLEGLGERAVDAAGRYELSALAKALDPDVTRGREQAQAKADQALKDGQKALDDLDALKALKLFDEAVAESKAGEPATKRGFDTYVLAGVMRAAAMVANGDNDAAKSEIKKILVYAPKAQFPDTQFPPDLIKFADAQRKTVQAATGTIIVRSDPPGAKVTIDGAFRGYAPVSATGFAPGQHLAVAQLGGYQTIAGEIPVDDQTVKLKPAEANSRLSLARDKVKKDPDGSGRDAAARDFGRLMSADQVLLLIGKASLTPGKLELIAERIDVKDGHNYGFRSGPVEPSPEPMQGYIGSVLLSDQPRNGGSIVTHFGGGSGKGGSTRTILAFSFWGLAVVGVGTGIFAGLEASDRAAQYRKTPQVQTILANNLASEGKTYALIADLSYAIAILAAAAGTFFFLTRPKAAGGAAPEPAPEQKKAPAETAKPPPPSDDQKKADERKKADEQKKADDAKKAEDQKKADEAKKAEEEKKDTRTEKQKRADERKRLAEEKKEEKRRKEEEAKEEKRKAEEQRKADAEAKKAEAQKKADDKKKAEEDAKKADEQKKADAKKADEDAKKAEEQKKADDAKKSEDQKKADADAKKAEETKRAQEKDDAKKAAEAKKADEQKGDAARKAEEQRKQQEAEQKKKDEARKKAQQDDEDLKNQ